MKIAASFFGILYTLLILFIASIRIFLFILIIPSVILPSLDLILLIIYRIRKLSLKSVVIIQILVSVTIVLILYLSILTLEYSPR